MKVADPETSKSPDALLDCFEETFNLDALPPLPAISLRLRHLLNEKRPPVKMIIATILSDPALTFRILSLLSQTSGKKYHPASLTVTRIINALGLKPIKEKFGDLSIFHEKSELQHRSGFDLYAFWKHSVFTALAAEALAAELGQAGTEEAYIAGLLHDIGRLAIARFCPSINRKLEKIQTGPAVPLQTEEKFLQATHLDIGAAIAAQQHLPKSLIEVIQNHHLTKTIDKRAFYANRQIPIVHVAQSISTLFYNRAQKINSFYEGRDLAAQLLKLSHSQFNTVVRLVSNKIYEMMDQIHVSGEIFQSYGQELEKTCREAEALRAALADKESAEKLSRMKIALLEDTLQIVREEHSRDGILHKILTSIYVHANVENIVLFLYDPRHKFLQAKLHFGLPPNDKLRWAKFDPATDNGVIVTTFKTGQPQNIARYEAAQLNGTFSFDEYRYVRTHPFATIPLVIQGDAVGVIYMSRGEPGKFISQELLEICTSILQGGCQFARDEG